MNVTGNRGNDTIWWVPSQVTDATINQAARHGLLAHRCPTSVVPYPTFREVLDPMALGECRYCHGRLPTVARAAW